MDKPTMLLFWLLAGLGSIMFCDWANRLSFPRKKLTIVTILFWCIGILLPPLALFVGVILWIAWLIEVPRDSDNHQWPDWWGRARWRIHLGARWVKYLGSPPAEEFIFSGWRHRGDRWKSGT